MATNIFENKKMRLRFWLLSVLLLTVCTFRVQAEVLTVDSLRLRNVSGVSGVLGVSGIASRIIGDMPFVTPSSMAAGWGESIVVEKMRASIFVPKFSLKTNLIFDAVLMPNVEFEWLFEDRFSLSLDYQFAWWNSKKHDQFYQMMMVSPEFRYWFKPDGRYVGHFAGVYVGLGYYDLKWQRNNGLGYQGELYFMAGLSYGYHLVVTPRFGVEFSVGIGYAVTKYRKYENVREYGHYDNSGNHYVHRGSDRASYIGPTKAKVSLVWRLGRNKIVSAGAPYCKTAPRL